MLISISSMQHKPKTNLILMFPSGGTFFETDKKVSLSFLSCLFGTVVSLIKGLVSFFYTIPY